MNFFQKRREVRGAIAVLMVVILLPMMTLSAFMVDTARYNLAKSMVSSAGDLAMNAGLADYDTILKDVYGLFAMSQVDDVEENIKRYFRKTLVDYGVVDETTAEDYVSSLLGSVYEYLVVEDKETVDFLSMSVEEADIKVTKAGGLGAAGSGLDNPDILEKQIVEYMKYRGPVDFGLSFVDSLSAFTKINSQAEVLEAQIKAQETMQEVTDANKALYDSIAAYDAKYRELEPEDALEGEFHLTTYGKRLNSYKDKYQALNKLTILFCLGTKFGKWDIADTDIMILNESKDYVEESEDKYSVTVTFSDSELAEAMFADADAFLEGLYKEAASEAVQKALSAYGTIKMTDSWNPAAGPDAMTDAVIGGFQNVDSFYKSSRYEAFLEAAEKVDYFVRAVEIYDDKAKEKIDELEEELKEVEKQLADPTLMPTVRAVLETNKTERESEKAKYENAKEKVDNSLQDILEMYEGCLNAYNSDVKRYRQCVSDVKDCVTIEAAGISTEISTIHDNLEELADLLADVETKLGIAKENITTYMGKVTDWETENSRYEGAGKDSFSEGNRAGINEAQNTFDLTDIQELQDAVSDEKSKVENCILQISGNFYFNGQHINRIYSAEGVKNAIVGGGHGTAIESGRSSREFSESDCNGFFEYYGHVDEDFLDDLKMFVEPYPCCRFMDYLYQTYHRAGETMTDAERSEAESSKAAYEAMKEGTDSTTSDMEEEPTVDFGYTYLGKTIGGEGYPSSGESADKVVSSSKSNGSDGMAENKKAAGNILNDLAVAMETGRDKLLVASYVFENFSYNTLVQDMAREGVSDETLSWYNCRADLYEPYLGQAVTSSGIKINGTNNQLYGAEIEYILFGNQDAAKNVSSVKASIFAIRFLFNAVFAFTDSGVRNETRAVALAVQAASAGIIPYQLVQVVLQVALAMGESAIDLSNMNAGAKVVLVKTKDTWTLSTKGMVNMAKDALKTVAKTAADKAVECINNKLAEITDAAADKLTDAVDGLKGDLEQCVNSATEEVLNALTLQINAEIDSVMGEIAYITDSDVASWGGYERIKTEALKRVEEAFGKVGTCIHTLLSSAEASENMVKKYAAENLASQIDTALGNAKTTVIEQIEYATDVTGIRSSVYQQVNKVKDYVSDGLKDKVNSILDGAAEKFKGKIDELNTYVKNCADEATEEAKEKILEGVNGFIDDLSKDSTKLVDDALSSNSLEKINGNSVSTTSKAAMISFGYSDYLKLFVFIGLCASDKSGAMLKRIGDVIQINIAQAGEDSDLCHKKGMDFRMCDAKTYISMEANVELKLMFMNIGIFQNQVEAYNAELEEGDKMDTSSTLTVRYIGVAGY